MTGRTSTSPTDADYATVGYDAVTGAELWTQRHATGGVGGTSALGFSPDGSRVFVTGGAGGAGHGLDYTTIAYDPATGAELWVSRYDGPANSSYDLATALTVSPDGSKLFVTGTSERDYATVAYDATTGDEVWATRRNGNDDGASAIGVSPDGSKVFVSGRKANCCDYDYGTVAYDASDGAELWFSRYSASDDVVFGLGVTPDGTKVFVTGASGSALHKDYATVAYDAATGTRLWVQRYDGPASGDDWAHALGVSPDGSKLFVTGESTGSGSGQDYATIAYGTATGARLWLKRYDGPAKTTDKAHALGVSPDGSKVFVTGESVDRNSDYATVGYDAATGKELWASRYRTGKGFATNLGVSPLGSKVFVTGRNSGSGTGYDYVTVAYSTG